MLKSQHYVSTIIYYETRNSDIIDYNDLLFVMIAATLLEIIEIDHFQLFAESIL